MTQQEIESLERSASAHYLQGDYQSAITAWHALLELDPANEQALEGIRLCHQLGGGTEEGLDFGQDAASFEALNDETQLDSPFGELEMDLPVEPSLSAGEPGSLSDSLKDSLSELALESDDDSIVTTVSSEETGAGSSDAGAEAAAAAELRRRVNELLTAAVSAMEQGQREESLSLLSRVLILDEDNQTAASLRSKIQAEVDAEQQRQFAEAEPAPEPELDWPDRTQQAAPIVERPFENALAAQPSKRAPVPANETAPSPPSPAREPVAPEKAAEGAANTARAKDPLKALRAARELTRRLPPKVMIPCGVLLLAAGIWFAWPRASSESDGTSQAAVAPGPARKEPERSQDPETQKESTQPQPQAAEREGMEGALRRADAAFDSEDFAAAVLAYNEALKLDPDNPVIQQKLVLAGNRYREQRAVLDQWQQAVDAFGTGDYERALHLLYRLPKGEDAADIQRYILNGWYNLGVQALQARDCRGALANFKEAEAVNASDPQVQGGLKLAKSCPTERGTTSFVIAAEGLRLRAMRDE
jgi:tetratricopeptide (TPR) repeat protein